MEGRFVCFGIPCALTQVLSFQTKDSQQNQQKHSQIEQSCEGPYMFHHTSYLMMMMIIIIIIYPFIARVIGATWTSSKILITSLFLLYFCPKSSSRGHNVRSNFNTGCEQNQLMGFYEMAFISTFFCFGEGHQLHYIEVYVHTRNMITRQCAWVSQNLSPHPPPPKKKILVGTGRISFLWSSHSIFWYAKAANNFCPTPQQAPVQCPPEIILNQKRVQFFLLLLLRRWVCL